MDELQEWELHLLANMIPWAHKADYEQTRLIMWSVLSPYFKKGVNKKPSDILPLATDSDYKEPERSPEEVNELRKIASCIKF